MFLSSSSQAEAAAIAGVLAMVAAMVKVLLSVPVRESAAYSRGRDDEAIRCKAEIDQLRAEMRMTEAEVVRLRSGLLRLAIAADLSSHQRADIALTLGLNALPPLPPTLEPEGDKDA